MGYLNLIVEHYTEGLGVLQQETIPGCYRAQFLKDNHPCYVNMDSIKILYAWVPKKGDIVYHPKKGRGQITAATSHHNYYAHFEQLAKTEKFEPFECLLETPVDICR